MTKQTKAKGEQAPEIKQSKTEKIFYLAKDQNGKICILVGKYKVSEKSFDTYKQAEEYIGTKPYELIFTTNSVITRTILEDEKTKEMQQSNKIDEKAETDK